jgi:hypothetical protein
VKGKNNLSKVEGLEKKMATAEPSNREKEDTRKEKKRWTGRKKRGSQGGKMAEWREEYFLLTQKSSPYLYNREEKNNLSNAEGLEKKMATAEPSNREKEDTRKEKKRWTGRKKTRRSGSKNDGK